MLIYHTHILCIHISLYECMPYATTHTSESYPPNDGVCLQSSCYHLRPVDITAIVARNFFGLNTFRQSLRTKMHALVLGLNIFRQQLLSYTCSLSSVCITWWKVSTDIVYILQKIPLDVISIWSTVLNVSWAFLCCLLLLSFTFWLMKKYEYINKKICTQPNRKV